MKDKSGRARRRAAELIGMILIGNRGMDALWASEDKERLDLLAKLLDDEDVQVRVQAALSLRSLHLDPKATSVFLEALQGRYSSEVRSKAAENLGSYVSGNEKVVQALRTASRDDDPQVRFQAALSRAKATGKLAQSVPVLIEALGDPDRKIRRQAASDLMQIFQQASIRVQSQGGEVNEASRELDTMAQIAVPALIDSLKERDRVVQWCAAHALGNLGPRARGAAPALARLLHEKEKGIAQAGAGALADLDAVPILLQLLKDSDKSVRGWAAWSLGFSRLHLVRQRTPDNTIIPVLISALKDEEPEVRSRAAGALALPGIEAGEAVPELVKCANDPDDSVRQTAISALRQIGKNTDGVNTALLQALKAENKEVRLAAATALWHIAQREEAIPVLLQGLEDNTPNWRLQEVVQTLGEGGPKAKAAIPKLREMLKDEDAHFVPDALNKIATGSARDEILNGLFKNLKDKDRIVCQRALHVLIYFKPPSHKVLPELTGLLKNDDADIRAAAVNYLGRMREGAADAIPAVKELEKDPEAKVRQAAKSALMTMETFARMERRKKEMEEREKQQP